MRVDSTKHTSCEGKLGKYAHHCKRRNHGPFREDRSCQQMAVVPHEAIPPLPSSEKGGVRDLSGETANKSQPTQTPVRARASVSQPFLGRYYAQLKPRHYSRLAVLLPARRTIPPLLGDKMAFVCHGLVPPWSKAHQYTSVLDPHVAPDAGGFHDAVLADEGMVPHRERCEAALEV